MTDKPPMKSNILSFKLIFILLGLFVAQTSWALAPRYQIELLIFSHITPQALAAEQWPIIDGYTPQLPPSQPLQVANDANLANNFTLLPPQDFTLQHDQERLEKSGYYKVILHIAWQQSDDSLSQPTTLHLYGGAGFDDQGQIVTTNPNGNLPFTAASVWQVNGTLRISVRRYFNLGFNLIFAAPTRELAAMDQTQYFSRNPQSLSFFQLSQSRRLKSGELDYIDHPLYGILVKITAITSKDDAD